MDNNNPADHGRLEAQDAAADAAVIALGQALEGFLLEAIAFLDDPANAGGNTLMRIYRGLTIGQQLFLHIQGLGHMDPRYQSMLAGIVDALGYAKCFLLMCIIVGRL